jgi:hypothetical protein
MTALPFSVDSLDRYTVHGTTVHIVRNPCEWSENPFLGHLVLLDHVLRRVVAVETYAHALPIQKDEYIGLVVE